MAAEEQETKGGFKFRYVFFGVILLLFLLAIFSHHAGDLSILEGGSLEPVKNLSGPLGARTARFLFYFFGLAAYPLTLFLFLCLLRGFLPYPTKRRGYTGAVAAVVIGVTILAAMWPEDTRDWTDTLGIGHRDSPRLALSGGVIGAKLAAPEAVVKQDGRGVFLQAGILRRHIGVVGTLIVALTFLLTGLVFIFLADWWGLIAGKMNLNISITRNKKPESAGENGDDDDDDRDGIPLKKDGGKAVPYRPGDENPPDGADRRALKSGEKSDDAPTPHAGTPETDGDDGQPPFDPDREDDSNSSPLPPAGTDARTDDPLPRPKITNGMHGSTTRSPLSSSLLDRGSGRVGNSTQPYVLPSINLFDKTKDMKSEDPEYLQWTQDHLQATLDSFGISGRVSNIVVGPRVTRYEISLDPGVKVEKIVGITNNIAMETKAESIRILAPIPGENTVGVEIPNRVSSNVYIRSLMEDEDWQNAKIGAGNIPIILGRDVAGRAVIANLAKAPHLLIAGSTGSGKSVCMNTLIMSLLCKFSPYDLRLILVDPKFVELAMYRPLPHLITPVVNDPKLVPLALRWGVNEMEHRYQLLASVKAKNLETFNKRPAADEPELTENGDVIPKTLPLLVIIVDELADIMMTDAKADVETSICRIAQKGRAAGIHLVIATQTPRKDVITGLIKANLPTKIAFRVGSNLDSRVILDKGGAESLLGKGDMLFLAPGGDGLERVQGSMVSDPEIQRVVDFVSAQVPQHFNSDVVAEAEIQDGKESGGRGDDEDDGDFAGGSGTLPPGAANSIAAKYLQPGDGDLMRKALEIILEERKVSTSYIQRRLGIGYNKSAELIDQLEKRGIISAPLPGGQKRDILILDELIDTNDLQ